MYYSVRLAKRDDGKELIGRTILFGMVVEIFNHVKSRDLPSDHNSSPLGDLTLPSNDGAVDT